MYALYALGFFLLGFVSAQFLLRNNTKDIKPACTTSTMPAAQTSSTPSPSKLLLFKLTEIYDDHKKKDYDDTVYRLKAKVPQYIIDRVPDKLLADLQKAIDKPPREYSFAAYYAMEFLKKYAVDDEMVIDWLANHYKISLYE